MKMREHEKKKKIAITLVTMVALLMMGSAIQATSTQSARTATEYKTSEKIVAQEQVWKWKPERIHLEGSSETLNIHKHKVSISKEGELIKANTDSNYPTKAEIGDTIHYKIMVTNDGNVAYQDVLVNDTTMHQSATIENIGVGETLTALEFDHKVAAEDIQIAEDVAMIKNEATLSVRDAVHPEELMVIDTAEHTIEARKQYHYTVNYYYDDEETPRNSLQSTEEVMMGEKITEENINAMPAAGYKIETIENAPLTITATEANNTINVRCVKDDSQTKTIQYTIEYYKDNEKVEEDTYTGTKQVWVNDEDTKLTVDKSQIDTTNNRYTGYEFSRVEPALDQIPEEVERGTAIKVYYTKFNDVTITSQAIQKNGVRKDLVNIILVLDVSGSMSSATDAGDGLTRIQAAKQAASNFIDDIYENGEDSMATVTLITFSSETSVIGDKTYDGTNYTELIGTDTTQGEIAKLSANGLTDVGLALNQVQTTMNELKESKPDNQNLVIFLTDGNPEWNSSDPAAKERNTVENIVAKAAEIKATPAEIYSIAFGTTATDPNSTAYKVLLGMSSTNSVYSSTDLASLSDNFSEMMEQFPPISGKTKNAMLTDITLERDLVVDERNPITATYNGETLFNITNMSIEDNTAYGFSYDETNNTYEWKDCGLSYDADAKEFLWDLNVWNAREGVTPIKQDGAILSYHIEDPPYKDITYTVEYWINDEKQEGETLTRTRSVWETKESVKVDPINTYNRRYRGYKFDRIEPADHKTAKDGDVIKVRYVTDLTDTKSISYTVEYYVDGVRQTSQTKSKNVWYNDTDTPIEVDHSMLNNETKYPGYKLDHVEPADVGDTIARGSTIKVYYVKDETQTHNISYTVEYYKEGVKQDVDTVTRTETKWINDNTLSFISSDIVADKYNGYTLEKTDPENLSTTVNAGDVVKVHYMIPTWQDNEDGTFTNNRVTVSMGDYINYTYDTNDSGYNIASTYSGTSSDQPLVQESTPLKWRVAGVENGRLLVVSETPTTQEVSFNGAKGYNNGVYFLNDACAKLYSNSTLGITARNMNIEDIESQMNDEGIAVRNTDADREADTGKYGGKRTYTSSSYCYYPYIYAYQIGQGIGSTDVNAGGKSESNAVYSSPTTNTYTRHSSYKLTTQQTYYHVSGDTLSAGIKNGSSSVLFTDTTFWLSSRYVDCSSSYAYYGLRNAGNGTLGGTYVTNSYNSNYTVTNHLRPVILLGYNIAVGATGGAADNPRTLEKITP